MSITSFSKPTDSEILKRVVGKDMNVSFVGDGSIRQTLNETIYIRTIRIKEKKEEILKNVIYIKKGITWFFKKVEQVA